MQFIKKSLLLICILSISATFTMDNENNKNNQRWTRTIITNTDKLDNDILQFFTSPNTARNFDGIVVKKPLKDTTNKSFKNNICCNIMVFCVLAGGLLYQYCNAQ